jgi:hypothetical protein
MEDVRHGWPIRRLRVRRPGHGRLGRSEHELEYDKLERDKLERGQRGRDGRRRRRP